MTLFWSIFSTPSPADEFTFTPYPELIRFNPPDSGSDDQSDYFVVLNGNAPLGGDTVTVTSGDPRIVEVPSLIPIQGISAPVPLTFLPTPTAKRITLTATYRGQSLTAVVPASPWPPIMIVPIVPPNAARRFTLEANVTITLPTLAPSGGTAVALQWSDPTAFLPPLPTNVIIPAGSYYTAFKVVATTPSVRNGVPVFKQITVTATPVNGTPVSVATSVPFPVLPSLPHGGPNGTRQY